jgi:dCTP deaminase
MLRSTLYAGEMLLSDVDLCRALNRGHLKVTPLDPADIQPASIDLHLADGLETFTSPLSRSRSPYSLIDPLNLPGKHTYPIAGPFALQPGELVLGSTVEHVSLYAGYEAPGDMLSHDTGPALAARFEGKSSLGRLGLLTHITAGFIDPGFSGTITLELRNVAPFAILLTPGMPIGQLCVSRVSSPVERPYGSPALRSRYQGQQGTTPSHGVDQGKQ